MEYIWVFVSYKYRKHTLDTDAETLYSQSCNFLNFKHRLHSNLYESNPKSNAVFQV